jgi:hypothetical protein
VDAFDDNVVARHASGGPIAGGRVRREWAIFGKFNVFAMRVASSFTSARRAIGDRSIARRSVRNGNGPRRGERPSNATGKALTADGPRLVEWISSGQRAVK